MLKVSKRKGSPYWQISGTVTAAGGSQLVRKSSGTTVQAQALEAASTLEARIRRELTYGVENETTFGEAALEYISAKNRDGEEICSPKLADLIRKVGDRKLATFSSGEIQDIAKEILPKATAATRNRHGIAPFMAVYNYAVERKKAPPMKVSRFEERQAKTVSIDKIWIEAFRAHCSDPYVRALTLLMFQTGMRLGAAIGLERSMLDMDACAINAPAALLKNDQDHSFPLSRAMADELAALPDIAEFNRTSGNRGQKRNPDRLFGFSFNSGVYRHWRSACRDAKIDYVPPHQAGRHSFATTMLVDHGIDPITVAEIAGWKDRNFMMKRYPHARQAKIRAVIERVTRGDATEAAIGTPQAHNKSTVLGGNVIKIKKSGS